MPEEFITLTKALKIPLLDEFDTAAIRQLQTEWSHWRGRERQIMPLRIAEEQKEAFTAFVESPTPEREYQLMLLADANLTGIRYGVLRKACAALRARISAQAAAILRPVLQRISAALEAEHTRRREAAEPIMSSKDRHPVVIESRKAIEYADRLAAHVLRACGGKNGDHSPLVLADVLMKPELLPVLTPEPKP